MELKIEIYGDSDGFIKFECPYCQSEFKLNQEITDYKSIFCPYCGLENEKEKFYAKEVIEQATQLANNYMVDELNKAFSKMAKSMNNNKVLRMKCKPLKKVNVKEIRTEDTVEEIIKCRNCNKHIKVLYCCSKSKAFCSYCGEVI